MCSMKHLLLAVALVALVQPLVWSKPQRPIIGWYPWGRSGISADSGSNSQSANVDQTQNNQQAPIVAINTDVGDLTETIGNASTEPASEPSTTEEQSTTEQQSTTELVTSEQPSSAAPTEESSTGGDQESTQQPEEPSTDSGLEPV